MSTTDIWNNIIVYAVQIGLLVGIGASLPALLRLKSQGARLVYWQLLLVACLAMPWVRPWRSEVIAVASAPIAEIQAAPQMLADAAPKSFVPSFAVIALLILAAGVAVRLAWLAAGFLKLAVYRRHGLPIPSPPAWTGTAGNARLLLSEEISGPVTFGFFRPVVLLPATFPSLSEATRDAILFHELLHVQRRDWLFTVAEELVRAAFWFHPAIWWVLGEIQLAREQTVDQAVIGMTQAPDRYVDALLAMAGVTAPLDLAPAPLFLRRRHLKQRVKGIVQEVRMSKTRLIFAQVTAVVAMAAACWFIADVVPLHAQAQTVADAAGVTVNLNGAPLLHRTPVLYPVEAVAKGVEGTVVVQVRLDSIGQVVDDAILSGPEELRKSIQQSVLNWHFDKRVASTVQVVNIDFVKPANSTAAATRAPVATRAQIVATAPVPGGRDVAPENMQQSLEAEFQFMLGQMTALEQDVSQTQDPTKAAQLEQVRKRLDEFKQANAQRLPQPAPSDQQAAQQSVTGFVQDMAKQAHQRLDQLRQQQAQAPTDQLAQEIQSQEKTTEEMDAKLRLARANLESIRSGNGPIQIPPPPSPRIESIEITGLSDSARDQLLAQLPVHVGDPWSADAEGRISEAAGQFDPHLMVGSTAGGRVVRIFVGAAPSGEVRVGSNVMAAGLVKPVKPVYPSLAKMARVQGTVSFQAMIGKDGSVQDLKLLSGPPLLVQAAMDAVKQWVYKPTLLNGAPVEVITTIDVNFSLSDGPPPAAQ